MEGALWKIQQQKVIISYWLCILKILININAFVYVKERSVRKYVKTLEIILTSAFLIEIQG